jgi:hypothetical protein
MYGRVLALDWRGSLSSICLTEAELLKSSNWLEWNTVVFLFWSGFIWSKLH